MLKTDRLFDDSGTASAACRTCLRVVTNRRGVGRIHFPAAAIAATALEPILDEGGGSELARGTGRTLDQLVIQYQSAADAFGDCDDHQIAQAFGAAAEADLCKCTGICGVFKLNRQFGCLLERRFQIEISPPEVGSEHEFLACEIDAAGETHADAFTRQLGSGLDQFAYSWNQFGDELVRICGSRQRVLREKVSVEIVIGREQVSTPVTWPYLVCRLLF